MNEILVAIIGSVGLLAVAVIANRGRQHAKAAREQVENEQSTNLREELDTRHRNVDGKLDNLVAWKNDHQAAATFRDLRIARVERIYLPTVAAAILVAVARFAQYRWKGRS